MIKRIIETYFFNGQYAPDRREQDKNTTPHARRKDDEIPKETSGPYSVPVNKFRGRILDITV
jgi:hypothetical protein